jgi:hypothetical protein
MIDNFLSIPEEESLPLYRMVLKLACVMHSALDVLELGLVRGVNTVRERKAIEKAIDDRNSSRLQTLVARVEAKIRNHDAAALPPVPLRRLHRLRRLRPHLLQKLHWNSKTTFKPMMTT